MTTDQDNGSLKTISSELAEAEYQQVKAYDSIDEPDNSQDRSDKDLSFIFQAVPAYESAAPSVTLKFKTDYSVSVCDAANYLLSSLGPVTSMKLQKLMYYCQAWSLVWDEAPLFNEEIQAWANGPVIPALFDKHRGQFRVQSISGGDVNKLSETQRETIDAVIEYYGQKSSQYLVDLTHRESPWLEARAGLPDNIRGRSEITLDEMANYYSSLMPQD